MKEITTKREIQKKMKNKGHNNNNNNHNIKMNARKKGGTDREKRSKTLYEL